MQIPETEIIVSKDGAEILRKTVRPGDYVIGSHAECELQVEAERVSQRHAQLIVNFDHALVEDLGSDSGTFVNGRPVTEPTRLWPNQKIQIGGATVELRRVKSLPTPDVSLAPQTAAVQQLLPEEFLREKRYDIGGVVAQGGMGAILDARETITERTVAMKVMLDGSNPGDLSRFVAEARVTAQLEHPNIVPVHELGVDENDQVFYTMKFVQGVTLKKALEGLAAGDADALKKYPLPALLTIFQKVCDALAFAHSKGVIHRDLKPENIMLGDFGEALVMDWGLAKKLGAGRAAEESGPGQEKSAIDQMLSSGTDTGSHTMAGAVLGTPQYMAPEQAEGRIEDMDARSDIFSLGGVLYAILTLRPPVEGRTPAEVLEKVISGSITAPSALGISTSKRKNPTRDNVSEAKKVPTPAPVESGMHGEEAQEDLTDEATTPLPMGAEMMAGAPSVKSKVLEARKITPLPHMPGGRVPAALSAVAMKALCLRQDDRYQTVVEFSADIAAYQNGFATRAEHASFMKQILLLIRRNKGVFGTAAAALVLLSALGVWFIISIKASERKTRRQAEIALQNEKLAKANEQTAKINEQAAKVAQAEAVAKGEAARQSLAKAALNFAEAAQREGNGLGMQAVLNEVPDDLRDSTWNYLFEQSDTSIASIRTDTSHAAPHPRLSGVFALGDAQGKVTVLDIRTGQRLLQFAPTFEKKTASFPLVAFSPDGERIAVGWVGMNGIVTHNARDGKELLEWDAPKSANLSFSPDGKLLLQTDAPHKHIGVWDAAEGKPAWSYPAEEGAHVHGAFSADGQQLVTFDDKEQLRLVNARDGSLIRPWPKPALRVCALLRQPDGTIVAGCEHGLVLRLDPRDGHVIFDFRVSGDFDLYNIALTPDGTRLAVVAKLPDGRQDIRVWDMKTAQPVRSLLGGVGDVREVAVHPLSGELVVFGPNTRAWSLTGTPPKWTFNIGFERSAFFGSDELVLTRASGSDGFILARLQAGNPAVLWKDSNAQYARATVSADGRSAALGWGNPGTVILLRNPGPAMEQFASFPWKPGLSFLRLSPTGGRILVSDSNAPELYSTATGELSVALERSHNKKSFTSIRDCGWLDEQRLVGLVTAGGNRGNPGSEEWIVLWDSATGKVLRTTTNRTAMDVLAVAPDGRRFAEAGVDRLVRIRDAETLAVVQKFRVHDGPITALAWHPTKPILATASADLCVRLWNLETGRRLEEFRSLSITPFSLAFSPGGQRLACSANDATRIWEPKSLNDQPDPDKAAGWEDLLAPLTPDIIAKTGNGWRMNGGALFSPGKMFATLPLPGNLSNTSYQVRVKLRQLTAKDDFHLVIPVADRMVGFELDGLPSEGFYTSLLRVAGKFGKSLPGAIHGKQVKDSEQHDLEVTVRPDGTNATITTTLDGQPLYEWSGPTADLSEHERWITEPGALALGASAADWVVYEVKVKRLEK